MLRHMTLNKLVLTSHLHQQHQHVCHWYCPVCMISVNWLLTLNKPLFQSFVSYAVCKFDVDLFNVRRDVPLVLFCLHDSSVIAGNLEQVIVSVICFPAQFAK